MTDTIILDDSFLSKCMNCGGKIQKPEVYKFYCCKKCEEEDTDRISEGIVQGVHPVDIMNVAMRKVSVKPKARGDDAR